MLPRRKPTPLRLGFGIYLKCERPIVGESQVFLSAAGSLLEQRFPSFARIRIGSEMRTLFSMTMMLSEIRRAQRRVWIFGTDLT